MTDVTIHLLSVSNTPSIIVFMSGSDYQVRSGHLKNCEIKYSARFFCFMFLLNLWRCFNHHKGDTNYILFYCKCKKIIHFNQFTIKTDATSYIFSHWCKNCSQKQSMNEDENVVFNMDLIRQKHPEMETTLFSNMAVLNWKWRDACNSVTRAGAFLTRQGYK